MITVTNNHHRYSCNSNHKHDITKNNNDNIHWNLLSRTIPSMLPRLEIFAEMVAKEVNVLKIDVPRPEGRGWKRTFSEIDTDKDLGEDWKKEMIEGAKYVLEESHVKANDPHYDLLSNE